MFVEVVSSLIILRHNPYRFCLNVFTDQKNLMYVLSQKDLNFHQMIWKKLLMDCDMIFLHHLSKTNVVADTFKTLSMESVAHVEDNKK